MWIPWQGSIQSLGSQSEMYSANYQQDQGSPNYHGDEGRSPNYQGSGYQGSPSGYQGSPSGYQDDDQGADRSKEVQKELAMEKLRKAEVCDVIIVMA